jgi:hypothetical protein
MARKGKTKGYYIRDDLREWLETEASKQNRSVSNFLATLLEKVKADGQ